VPLLFTTTRVNPFTDRARSREWAKWRDAASWSVKHGTLHALRHFYATLLISAGVEPKKVLSLLRHKTCGSRWRPTCGGGRSENDGGESSEPC
jgi:site-specific recombinase XerD